MESRIEKRALSQVGVPFRLHGRRAGTALDCVGLVAHCIGQNAEIGEVPKGYSIRGMHQKQIEHYFAHSRFQVVHPASLETGDIAAVSCAPRQSHLMICVTGGWVHAHAGLGCVVLTPDPIGWPIWGAWRVKES
jgi:murein DD-endopeptidase / murein LD-carboxypeptidase